MGYQALACAIVEQAVEDYRNCKKDGYMARYIGKFFTSKWCAILLEDTNVHGEDILMYLQNETDEERRKYFKTRTVE